MDGREDQIILVEQRRAGLVAGGVRRIERQFGQEALARRIAGRDLLELQEIGLAHRGVVVDAFEMRLVPAARLRDLRRPAGSRRRQAAARLRRNPASRRRRAAAAPCWKARQADWIRPAIRSSARCAEAGPTPGSSCISRKPATRSRGFSREAQQSQHVLDMGAVEKFQAAELDEGNVAPGQFDLERAAVMGGAKQHGLLLQRRAALAVFQRPVRRCSAPGRPRRGR